MRTLAVDMGDRRTGVALSDPFGITCSPLEVIEESNQERLVQRIIYLTTIYGTEELVVGLPRPLSGGTNRQVEKVLAFVAILKAESQLDVKTWDERFTSKLAEQTGQKTGPRDSVAACYLLQNYLDALVNAKKLVNVDDGNTADAET